MKSPMLDRINKRRIGDSGRRRESDLARKSLAGRQTIGSGNIDGDKGDIEAGRFLIEVKSTAKASFSLKADWLHKITAEALAKSKVPVLLVSFTTAEGRETKNGDWVMVPRSFFDNEIL